VQQPTLWNKVRVDNCPGYGIKIRGQDGMFYNLQTNVCGTGLVLGGTSGEVNPGSTIMKFYALDIENSTTQAMLFNNSSDILIDGFHGETNPITFNVPSGGSMTNATFVQTHISYSGTDVGWKIQAGATPNSDFQIIGHRAYGAGAGQKIINDIDRSRDLLQEDLDSSLVLGVFVQPSGAVLSHTVEKVPAFVSARTAGALSFGSIGAGATALVTEAVTGATSAMAVSASPEGNIGTSFVWSARVSSPGNIDIIVANVTASPATPTSLNWRIVAGATV
jgi:hypothetical protein